MIRLLTELAELRAAQRLLADIWRNEPFTSELLRALSKADNYVAGAFDGTELVGVCVGFFGAPARRELHSHIAGVRPSSAGRGIGYALKLHQREWALRHGVTTISWTFDPLVRRNAYFNLAKLAAVPVQYLPNFYGSMHDAINGDDDTDRLLVHWDLTGSSSELVGDAPDAVVALDHDAVPGRTDAKTLLVAVPPDIERMRREDPARAHRWRIAVRDVLAPLLDDGATIRGFDKAGCYVIDTSGVGA